jgi:hypothetical protein
LEIRNFRAGQENVLAGLSLSFLLFDLKFHDV